MKDFWEGSRCLQKSLMVMGYTAIAALDKNKVHGQNT
jgi:hypothetical protein